MQARKPWNLVAGLGSSGWKKSPVQARLWVYKPCSLLSWLIESPTSGTEEWLARAGLFSCTVIFVFSIIFLVFRNNIHQQTLDSSKLCLSEVCHFHPILHSPPSETLQHRVMKVQQLIIIFRSNKQNIAYWHAHQRSTGNDASGDYFHNFFRFVLFFISFFLFLRCALFS